MNLTIPELALVLLVGPSGSGKSTFARRHFKPTEVISSDACRGLVADDENDQSATNDAFEVLHFIARKRLQAGRLTVIDATNVQPEARKPLLALARECHVLPVAIVFNLPEELCHERNRQRPDRDFGPHVVRRQRQDMRRSLGGLQREGFRYIYTLDSAEQVDAASITRQRLWTDRRDEHGPFDIIGDIHGCYDELTELLANLGYMPQPGDGSDDPAWVHPAGRTAVFLGDLVDRGPKVVEVLKLAMAMVAAGTALAVPGNHDEKLLRKLRGRDVKISHGMAETLAQLEQTDASFQRQLERFLDGLVSHFVLDDGKLVVAHAGMRADLQGRASERVRTFALYGETSGETDEFGLPIRYNWAADYRGKAMVVYGHTPVPAPEWLNNTINIDTGCVYGGRLTALRYPERELVSVPARATYAEPLRPLQAGPGPLSAQQQHDDLLDIDDVIGKRLVETSLYGRVTVREEQATAALEVMSRFAANPKWLLYLPPTMSPSETSKQPGLLEHPAEAFAYFRNQGLGQVLCEEKHMGSRAVVVLCRDEEAARQHFGVVDEGIGIVYTRTGRRFFTDAALEGAFLARLRDGATEAGLWEELNSPWLLLDCELMPWSAKAQELLRSQYAAVGAAARAAFPPTIAALDAAAARGLDVASLWAWNGERQAMTEAYVESYRRYCWPVHGLDDLRLAPFHLLASAGAVHVDKPHQWHMAALARLAAADPGLLVATATCTVELNDPASEAAAIAWWEELTGRGGEGMVVKPADFIARGPKGLVQPAVKCRGREYLRIIYGPEYTAPSNLERLRQRGLGAKRGLALREFALGVEGLERFVRGEPLRRVHECVFAVLALESEPVDPRL
ncbi:MAG: polynucleotide kinase-phosphatase [Chloroflexaceae bacterium]|jgi:protein phosphatase|nr:polynucleotide kinase-phosphatase [Chloroflexaceae bacterium]